MFSLNEDCISTNTKKYEDPEKGDKSKINVNTDQISLHLENFEIIYEHLNNYMLVYVVAL